MPKWTQEFDPDSGAYYYYNTQDGSSSWEVPIDYEIDVPEQKQKKKQKVMYKTIHPTRFKTMGM